MLNILRKSLSAVWPSAAKPVGLNPSALSASPIMWKRSESKYNAYPTFDTPSPYRNRKGIRKTYQYKYYVDGPLPRPEGEWENIALPMPEWDADKADNWTAKKAAFGQNDYIDILGDGTVHPWQLHEAPEWLKGYKGNELQRIARQLSMQGRFLEEVYPTKYHTLTKLLNYQFKKMNRRQHAPYWGGYKRFSRIDKPKKRY